MSAGNAWFDGLHACDAAAAAVVELMGLNADFGEPSFYRLVDGTYGEGNINGPAGVCIVRDGEDNAVYIVTVSELRAGTKTTGSGT